MSDLREFKNHGKWWGMRISHHFYKELFSRSGQVEFLEIQKLNKIYDGRESSTRRLFRDVKFKVEPYIS